MLLPTRLYAEAFWFTLADNDSGRGGIGGVLDKLPDVLFAVEGAVKAFDAWGPDAPLKVEEVGEGTVARCMSISFRRAGI